MKNILFCFVSVCCTRLILALTIDLPECDPPDYPLWGGYGPRQDFYVVGDAIHYYCDVDTYIGGNFYRRCEDNGDWSGDTPVCDSPTEFSSVNQSSTAVPEEENDAELVTDGLRSTCSSTAGGNGDYWMGIFKNPGECIRVMVFVPRVDVAYEVILLRKNGQDISCGSRVAKNDRLGWEFHNCPGPNNSNAIGVKIKSLSAIPLQICEVAIHVLTAPTCTDPHVHIDNGRVQLSRKVASLVCDSGYTRSPNARIECIRTGVWTRKSLYCLAPTCTDPHVHIDNGRVQLSRKVASLVCDSGYTRSPNARIECIRTGVWTRKSLYCLEREWEVKVGVGSAPENDP